MDNEETMVEMNDVSQADDTPVEGIIEEEAGEPEESVEAFSEEEGESAKAEEQPVKQGTSEPGYVQKRIDKAVARALAAERENIRAEYEQRFAPLQERMIEMDARDLVASGKVKDLETARELVRFRQNMPQSQPKAEQPRQQNGQFAQKADPVQEAQINLLTQQAVKIKNRTGVDVIAIMDSDPAIKDAITSGEMDFYDVLEQQQKHPAQAKRKAPAPMRSPNGATAHSPNAIEAMSDEQFRRMEKKISEGARYKLT